MINCTVLFRVLIGIVLIGLCYSAVSQDAIPLQDSINQVIVIASKLDADQHNKTQLTSASSIIESLNGEGAVQLQSNGPGFLATPLIHGFGARHTAILWNNFNIQSPINGTFDLNLLTGFNDVSYIDKSTSAYLGTASLAGAILLNQSNNTKLTQLSLSLNSLDNVEFEIMHDFEYSKLKSNINAKLLNNNNAFNYKWAGSESSWYSSISAFDIKSENEYQISNNLILQANIWLQEFDREIPSSLVSAGGLAKQSDNNYRYNASLNYSSNDLSGAISYAHFSESLNFATVGVDSRAKNNVNAINLSLTKAEHLLNLSYRQDNANANFFSSIINRNLATISYRYRQHWSPYLFSSITLAEERFDEVWSPLIFDVSTTYTLNDLGLSLSFNRAYNVPTLNDLYWPQGGNPDLLPESAVGFDLDFSYAFSKAIKLSIDPYYKTVDNWILWSPGDQFWTPKNQRSVTAKGVDLTIDFSLGKNINGKLNTAYNSTTVSKELRFNDLEGKQLIYVPKIKSSLWLDYTVNKWTIKPEVRFYSKRYVSTDNESWLPSYAIVNLKIEKEITIGLKNKISIGLKGYNMLNTDYQQVQFYPMPLRYIELKINFKIDRNE